MNFNRFNVARSSLFHPSNSCCAAGLAISFSGMSDASMLREAFFHARNLNSSRNRNCKRRLRRSFEREGKGDSGRPLRSFQKNNARGRHDAESQGRAACTKLEMHSFLEKGDANTAFGLDFFRNTDIVSIFSIPFGELVERFKASVLKTDEGRPSAGSNPALPAIRFYIVERFGCRNPKSRQFAASKSQGISIRCARRLRRSLATCSRHFFTEKALCVER